MIVVDTEGGVFTLRKYVRKLAASAGKNYKRRKMPSTCRRNSKYFDIVLMIKHAVDRESFRFDDFGINTSSQILAIAREGWVELVSRDPANGNVYRLSNQAHRKLIV